MELDGYVGIEGIDKLNGLLCRWWASMGDQHENVFHLLITLDHGEGISNESHSKWPFWLFFLLRRVTVNTVTFTYKKMLLGSCIEMFTNHTYTKIWNKIVIEMCNRKMHQNTWAKQSKMGTIITVIFVLTQSPDSVCYGRAIWTESLCWMVAIGPENVVVTWLRCMQWQLLAPIPVESKLWCSALWSCTYTMSTLGLLPYALQPAQQPNKIAFLIKCCTRAFALSRFLSCGCRSGRFKPISKPSCANNWSMKFMSKPESCNECQWASLEPVYIDRKCLTSPRPKPFFFAHQFERQLTNITENAGVPQELLQVNGGMRWLQVVVRIIFARVNESTGVSKST